MGLKEAFLRQGVYFQEVETYLKQNRLEVALDKLRGFSPVQGFRRITLAL